MKKEYPDITFISTLTWYDDEWGKQFYDKTDMYDVHWYVTPDEFYDDADLFDNATRGDYKVYAGEYAANNEVGSGNMDAALSEAVFVGGMERNSDLVTMASYAPLLVNTNKPNWSCNLIWLDNDQVMGRASYYVQKMYADNRPDYNVKTRILSDRQTIRSKGRIGLGTWNTQAKFRNVKVTSNDGKRTFFKSDFANAKNQWTEGDGAWTVDNDGNYVQSDNKTPCVSLMNRYSFANSTIELEAMKTSGNEGFQIIFGGDTLTTKNYYQMNIGGWGNTKTAIERVVNGGGTVISEKADFKVETNKWYKIKVVMDETTGIYCYVDGKLILTYKTQGIKPGRVQAFGGYDKANGEMVIKVVNATDSVMKSTLHLNAENIQPTGRVITLAANSLKDENTMADPLKISPKEESHTGFSKEFEYTFKPNSFTIMRVKADANENNTLNIPSYTYSDTPERLY